MTPLKCSQLTKTYRNGVQALKGIDLQVKEGDFFALLGPNGAGKSTAIGIICSLVRKTAGKVAVFGHDLDEDPFGARCSIGLVPQEFNFNQFESVINIIANQAGYYGISWKQAFKRAEPILKRLDLWQKRHTEARFLSGGMKRRLLIARALLHKPSLLILDEPTAGVDIEIRHTMWQFMSEINEQGTTIILTTHYLEEAESLCRNIAIINHGHIVECTSMNRLLQRLSGECVVLNLHEPLQEMPLLAPFCGRRIDALTLEVEISDGHSLNELFCLLHEKGIRVSSLRNKQNRLERLFLDLVQGGAPA
ncbi:MAG: ABC transporter ATP-binding protein [gamma proteobacterium symbiont of Bathyaustriella thionipta]|nr:ABC transporter ATP-binding protein [gamma proteobacterium symbiont of Bathyaustriella thionipta]